MRCHQQLSRRSVAAAYQSGLPRLFTSQQSPQVPVHTITSLGLQFSPTIWFLLQQFLPVILGSVFPKTSWERLGLSFPFLLKLGLRSNVLNPLPSTASVSPVFCPLGVVTGWAGLLEDSLTLKTALIISTLITSHSHRRQVKDMEHCFVWGMFSDSYNYIVFLRASTD